MEALREDASPLEAALKELERAIKGVEQEIAKVEEKLKPLEEKPLKQRDQDEKDEIMQLRKEKEQLRTKEEQLREEKKRAEEKEMRMRQQMSLSTARSVRHSIPRLAAATISKSKSSLATGHEPAKLNECDDELTLLPECGQPRLPVQSIIWQRLESTSGKELDHSTEASVQTYVLDVLTDVVYELGLNKSLRIVPEVETFGLRPDAWVMKVMGLPIGVIEVKNPGEEALSNDRVAGELYDYMRRLSSFYGVQEAFGILTTYQEWRVCWMDDDSSKLLAGKPVSFDVNQPQEEAKTPLRGKIAEIEDSSPEGVMDEKLSPEGATPSKKPADVHPLDVIPKEYDNDESQDRDEASETIEDASAAGNPRHLCCSRVYKISKDADQKLLFRLLASAVLKMCQSVRIPLPAPFDCLKDRTLLRFTHESFFWDRMSPVKPQWDKMPTGRALNLYAVEDLGNGASGRCWLVCSKAGRVAVLKFFRTRRLNDHPAKIEKKNWDAVYPQLGKMVKVEKWGGHWALVMPHLSQSVVRDKQALDAVRTTLLDDYVGNNMMQPVEEVRWRNIGFYKSGTKLKAVVFDMSHVQPLSETCRKDWVEECIEKLKEQANVQ